MRSVSALQPRRANDTTARGHRTRSSIEQINTGNSVFVEIAALEPRRLSLTDARDLTALVALRDPRS